MTALMADPKKAGRAKVTFGFRIEPELKDRLEEIADEISRERYPAQINGGELAAVAIREYIERYDAAKTRARSKGKDKDD